MNAERFAAFLLLFDDSSAPAVLPEVLTIGILLVP
jgi:hypothetical protein